MASFRQLVDLLRQQNELLTISRAVDPRFELGALLKQAEARRKAVLFESVAGSDFPVVGGLLTSGKRFGQGLSVAEPAQFTLGKHAALLESALAAPVPVESTTDAACKEVIKVAGDVDLAVVPVPTFFAGDSGPFLTAAVGIARNPDNDVVNAGFYRVLMLDAQRVAVSVSPGSDLYRFIKTAGAQGTTLSLALVIGMEPALLMAAAAKVPADISELDVAGALQGAALQTVRCESTDLPVPAAAEMVIEVELDPADTLENTMGEFGDLYGTQTAFIGNVSALTHRRDAVFHAVLAGAGKEHNTLGMIILYGVAPDLLKQLAKRYPDVTDVRLIFEPPKMGARGDVFVAMRGGRKAGGREIIEFAYSLTCGHYPLSRIIRRIVLVDDDIDLDAPAQLQWVVAARAINSADYQVFETEGAPVRLGVDTRCGDAAELQRLEIPGMQSINLDDYLD